MKKIITSSLVLLFCIFAKAQTSSPEALSSGGGFATGSGFTNSFTIGQGSLPETFSAGTFMLTQGFQQPADGTTGFAPASDPFLFGAFPNPTSGQLFLEYDLENAAEITVEVFDVLGQPVYSEISSRTTGHQIQSVNISNQANGIYFVRCSIASETGIAMHTAKITLTH
jgi:hypothetical protein